MLGGAEFGAVTIGAVTDQIATGTTTAYPKRAEVQVQTELTAAPRSTSTEVAAVDVGTEQTLAFELVVVTPEVATVDVSVPTNYPLISIIGTGVYNDYTLFLPAGDPPAGGWPVAHYVHGGSWQSGSRFVTYATGEFGVNNTPGLWRDACVAAGIAVATSDYPLSDLQIYDNTCRYPTQPMPIKEVKTHVYEIQQMSFINENKYVMTGHSAGTQVALMVALTVGDTNTYTGLQNFNAYQGYSEGFPINNWDKPTIGRNNFWIDHGGSFVGGSLQYEYNYRPWGGGTGPQYAVTTAPDIAPIAGVFVYAPVWELQDSQNLGNEYQSIIHTYHGRRGNNFIYLNFLYEGDPDDYVTPVSGSVHHTARGGVVKRLPTTLGPGGNPMSFGVGYSLEESVVPVQIGIDAMVNRFSAEGITVGTLFTQPSSGTPVLNSVADVTVGGITRIRAAHDDHDVQFHIAEEDFITFVQATTEPLAYEIDLDSLAITPLGSQVRNVSLDQEVAVSAIDVESVVQNVSASHSIKPLPIESGSVVATNYTLLQAAAWNSNIVGTSGPVTYGVQNDFTYGLVTGTATYDTQITYGTTPAIRHTVNNQFSEFYWTDADGMGGDLYLRQYVRFPDAPTGADVYIMIGYSSELRTGQLWSLRLKTDGKLYLRPNGLGSLNETNVSNTDICNNTWKYVETHYSTVAGTVSASVYEANGTLIGSTGTLATASATLKAALYGISKPATGGQLTAYTSNHEIAVRQTMPIAKDAKQYAIPAIEPGFDIPVPGYQIDQNIEPELYVSQHHFTTYVDPDIDYSDAVETYGAPAVESTLFGEPILDQQVLPPGYDNFTFFPGFGITKGIQTDAIVTLVNDVAYDDAPTQYDELEQTYIPLVLNQIPNVIVSSGVLVAPITSEVQFGTNVEINQEVHPALHSRPTQLKSPVVDINIPITAITSGAVVRGPAFDRVIDMSILEPFARTTYTDPTLTEAVDWTLGLPTALDTGYPKTGYLSEHEDSSVALGSGSITIDSYYIGSQPSGATIDAGSAYIENFATTGDVIEFDASFPNIGGARGSVSLVANNGTTPRIDIESWYTITGATETRRQLWTAAYVIDGTDALVDDHADITYASNNTSTHRYRIELDFGETRIYKDSLLVNRTFAISKNQSFDLVVTIDWLNGSSTLGNTDTSALTVGHPSYVEANNKVVVNDLTHTGGVFNAPIKLIQGSIDSYDRDTYTLEPFVADARKEQVLFLHNYAPINNSIAPKVSGGGVVWQLIHTQTDSSGQNRRRVSAFKAVGTSDGTPIQVTFESGGIFANQSLLEWCILEFSGDIVDDSVFAFIGVSSSRSVNISNNSNEYAITAFTTPYWPSIGYTNEEQKEMVLAPNTSFKIGADLPLASLGVAYSKDGNVATSSTINTSTGPWLTSGLVVDPKFNEFGITSIESHVNLSAIDDSADTFGTFDSIDQNLYPNPITPSPDFGQISDFDISRLVDPITTTEVIPSVSIDLNADLNAIDVGSVIQSVDVVLIASPSAIGSGSVLQVPERIKTITELDLTGLAFYEVDQIPTVVIDSVVYAPAFVDSSTFGSALNVNTHLDPAAITTTNIIRKPSEIVVDNTQVYSLDDLAIESSAVVQSVTLDQQIPPAAFGPTSIVRPIASYRQDNDINLTAELYDNEIITQPNIDREIFVTSITSGSVVRNIETPVLRLSVVSIYEDPTQIPIPVISGQVAPVMHYVADQIPSVSLTVNVGSSSIFDGSTVTTPTIDQHLTIVAVTSTAVVPAHSVTQEVELTAISSQQQIRTVEIGRVIHPARIAPGFTIGDINNEDFDHIINPTGFRTPRIFGGVDVDGSVAPPLQELDVVAIPTAVNITTPDITQDVRFSVPALESTSQILDLAPGSIKIIDYISPTPILSQSVVQSVSTDYIIVLAAVTSINRFGYLFIPREDMQDWFMFMVAGY